MAVRGPFKRWRLAEPVRGLDDVIRALRDIEELYAELVRVLEIGSDVATGLAGTPPGSEYLIAPEDPSTLSVSREFVDGQNTTVNYGTPGEVSIDAADAPPAPDPDATFIVQTSDPSVPNARELVAGQNTSVNYGTPGDASIDVPNATTIARGVVELATNGQVAAGLAVQSNDARLSNPRTPTGAAGGDLGSSYPSPIVDGIHGISLQSGTPTDGDLWQYNSLTGEWLHIQQGGDLDGSPSSSEVIAIRGNGVEAGTPAHGDVYRYDGTGFNPQFRRWSPKYITATLSAAQSSNLAAGNHVEFDTLGGDSGHVSLSTGAGQANGVLTIPGGPWVVMASIGASFNSAAGEVALHLADNADDSEVGVGIDLGARPLASASAFRRLTSAFEVIVLPSTTDVKLEIISSTNVASILQATHITLLALA